MSNKSSHPMDDQAILRQLESEQQKFHDDVAAVLQLQLSPDLGQAQSVNAIVGALQPVGQKRLFQVVGYLAKSGRVGGLSAGDWRRQLSYGLHSYAAHIEMSGANFIVEGA